ncbi:hypothetical protein [Bifidobacterium margollesii]|uniref:hypothetical protein n=1 Tax=Bifidobacterium margollesii TaxID=2020964 RepID=UPI0013FE006C|nr:hypothetical protein [Bifidobacterium margollesii]
MLLLVITVTAYAVALIHSAIGFIHSLPENVSVIMHTVIWLSDPDNVLGRFFATWNNALLFMTSNPWHQILSIMLQWILTRIAVIDSDTFIILLARAVEMWALQSLLQELIEPDIPRPAGSGLHITCLRYAIHRFLSLPYRTMRKTILSLIALPFASNMYAAVILLLLLAFGLSLAAIALHYKDEWWANIPLPQ